MDAVTLAVARATGDKRWVKTLGPSNGTDDTTWINALLAAGGYFRGLPGQTYTLSDALVMRSNSTLDMTGCTVNGSPLKNLIKNAAVVPARTVADAATTAGSATVTSPTANFTAADVGKAVQVLSAGPNFGNGTAPGSLYGTITAVNSTTSITVSQPATITRGAVTLNVFPARDSNITVLGGTWNGGQKDSTSQNLDGHGFLFRRVDHLTVHGLRMTNTRTTQGGAYAIAPADVNRVNIYDCDFTVGSAAVQFQGPARYVSVHEITGTCNDDMVAFVAVDGQTVTGSLLGDVEGDIRDVTVNNIHSTGSFTLLKLAAGVGANGTQRKITSFHAANLTGSAQQGVVNVVDYAGTTYFEGEIRGVSAIPGAGFAQITLGATKAKSVRLSEVLCDGSQWLPSLGIINVTAPVYDLHIDGLTCVNVPSGIGAGVRVAANVLCLRLNRLGQLDTGGSGVNSISGVTITAANLTIGQIIVTNVRRDAQTTNLIQIDSVATGLSLGDVIVSDGYQAGTSVINDQADNTGTVRVRISNWRQAAGALVNAQFPCDVNLSNVEVAPTISGNPAGAAVRANSAAATPVRVRASNVVVTGSGTSLLSRTASQALSAVGSSATADLALLTPADGDVVYNTNAALSCGTGPAIFHTGGTGNGWKNLYSGATY